MDNEKLPLMLRLAEKLALPEGRQATETYDKTVTYSGGAPHIVDDND